MNLKNLKIIDRLKKTELRKIPKFDGKFSACRNFFRPFDFEFLPWNFGPWCFVYDEKIVAQHCFQRCSPDLKIEREKCFDLEKIQKENPNWDFQYFGSKRITISGRECKRWTDVDERKCNRAKKMAWWEEEGEGRGGRVGGH